MKPITARFLLPFLLLGACTAPVQETGLPDLITEQYQEPNQRQNLEVGNLMVECERHLRSWKTSMNTPRSDANRAAIHATELALATVVHREQRQLEEQAISGPTRNRAIASAALGFSGDNSVLPLLLNNVGSDDDLVASSALLGLGILADETTSLAPMYEKVMDIEASENVLRNSAFAALRICNRWRKDPDGTLSSILTSLLTRSFPEVRGQAAIGLGLIRASHTVPLLQTRLKEDVPNNRMAAAWALG